MWEAAASTACYACMRQQILKKGKLSIFLQKPKKILCTFSTFI